MKGQFPSLHGEQRKVLMLQEHGFLIYSLPVMNEYWHQQQGQKELLNEIAEKYYDDIYRFCCYLTGQSQDAYDLAQETFLRFIRYVDRYRYRNLKGYLLTIARNVCMDYLRQNKGEVITDAQGKTPEAEAGEWGASRDEISALVERQFLWGELLKLPQFQREALILYYYSGLKIREIAVMTGVSASTVKSRLRQGTEKLKKGMEEDGK